MIDDTGLQGGAADLRHQQLLLDFTIKVKDREFRVHKFVLASVSDYFRAMICGSMSESTNDVVEINGVEVEHMSELMDFIYTGNPLYMDNNPQEMLELAVYFQLPKLIEKCKRTLHNLLSVNNCVELLAIFKIYSMEKDVNLVSSFISSHVTMVMKYYDVQDITLDVMTIILNNWNKSEWDMYQYLQSWISADCENREKYTSDFMKQIKFSVMTQQQIKNIKEMKWFEESEGEWKEFVDKAFVKHEQTAKLKVLDHSNQFWPRHYKSPFLLSIAGDGRGKTNLSVLIKIDADNSSFWMICESIDSPQVTGRIPFFLEANNMLITCSEFGENQTWQAFNPLTFSWREMPNMPQPKDDFTMVYDDNSLYVLGGTIGAEKCLTDSIEEYSFETNSWSCTSKLPVAMKHHSACVLNDSIYISGGMVLNDDGLRQSDRLDCLNTYTGQWESKAPMHKPLANHKMCAMTISDQDALVVVDKNLEVSYYDPAYNQWSTCRFLVDIISMVECEDKHDFPFKYMEDISLSPESMILTEGNTLYLLNLNGEEWNKYDDFGNRDPHFESNRGLCAKWKVDYTAPKWKADPCAEDEFDFWMTESDESDDDMDTEERRPTRPKMVRITQFGMSDFPMEQQPNHPPPNVIGGVLAFSAVNPPVEKDFSKNKSLDSSGDI